MNKPKILVVEDDPSIRNLMSTTLRTQGYKFQTADSGRSALQQAAAWGPEVVLLDLGLPDMDGMEVLQQIRSWSQMPVIVISARGEDSDKIQALDAGADDYLTKPFSVEELLARLRVTARRLAYMKSASGEPVFVNGPLSIDFAAGQASVGGLELRLTPMEYKLLCLLAQNMGKVLTHTFITGKLWGASGDSEVSSLRVFMATLRKKLGCDCIQTHIGVGYRMLKLE